MGISISIANDTHLNLAEIICHLIEEAARIRGTGIAKRSPLYIKQKIAEGKAVIALDDQILAGFCYIETWGDEKFVVNSGLIVHPDYRKTGLAKKIKTKILDLSLNHYPDAKVFGITTSLAVMKINSELGYKPVTFSELTDDENFWKGCHSCVNYDILSRTNKNHCLCTGMIYDPIKKSQSEQIKVRSRWENFQRFVKLRQLQFQKRFNGNSTVLLLSKTLKTVFL